MSPNNYQQLAPDSEIDRLTTKLMANKERQEPAYIALACAGLGYKLGTKRGLTSYDDLKGLSDHIEREVIAKLTRSKLNYIS